MSHRFTLEMLLKSGRETQKSASRLSRRGRLFAGRQARRFVETIESFIHAMHRLPQAEAAGATPEQETSLRQLVDGIIEEVERFLAAHPPDDRDELERNQHLAARIYDLRQAFEAIARGATPNPKIIDLRREERLRTANQPKR